MEWVIVLLVAGAVLLLLETILPGMIAGIAGLICFGAGVVHSYVAFGPETGTTVLVGVLVSLMIGTILWLKFFPNTRTAKLFTSNSTVGSIGTEKPDLLNQSGTALTPLRPSGTALINGHRVDVVTEGGMVDRHTPIIVVAIEGMRVVVRALSETSAQSNT